MADDAAVLTDSSELPAAPTDTGAKPRVDWWGEVKGLGTLLLAVLAFHSFIAKPFYIPSESMLPGLFVGDRLIVSKYAYGWSFVSPTIPNPVAIVEDVVFHRPVSGWTYQLPFIKGRLWGALPARGDIVIVTPPGGNSDYIKRVIGLPGDTIAVHGGVVILNGRPLARGPKHFLTLHDYGGTALIEGGTSCDPIVYGASVSRFEQDGATACRLPVVTETLPDGRSYETVDDIDGSAGDEFAQITVPAGHVFLMGDNRDHSADSRFSADERGLGGPVPVENIGGRAEFITFSVDGAATWNPLTWPGALRGGRAGTSLHPAEAGR